MTRTAVITVVHRRHLHLRRQRQGLGSGADQADLHVVVAVADPGIPTVLDDHGPRAEVVHLPSTPTGLPLATARNTGARRALSDGAALLVFLDVDCIPGETMLRRYRSAAVHHPDHLLCGPVTYLSAEATELTADLSTLPRLTDPHPARPDPADGTLVGSDDYDFFWSLSFAVTSSTWSRIGGFCAEYTGYGGEDTDFAQLARSAGVPLGWVGGAHAYHQHHAVSDPPVEHIGDICRNANLFHRRWGRPAMPGWLHQFEERGLVVRTGDTWRPVHERTAAPRER